MEKYWIIGGGVLLGVLLIGSIVVSLSNDEDVFDPGTPEYAVQQYLLHIERGDFETAHGSLSPDLQSECSVEELFKQLSGRLDRLDDNRITLESVQLVGETTSVTVEVHEFRRGDLFGSSEWSHEHRFFLRQIDGEWNFTEFPWPLNRCEPSARDGNVPPVRTRPVD